MKDLPDDGQEGHLVDLRLVIHNAKLVEARKFAGFTQVEASRLCGINQRRLSEIELLKSIPTDDEMDFLSILYGKTSDELFPESLMKAAKVDVFSKLKRKRYLDEPEVEYLTERHIQSLGDGGDGERQMVKNADRLLLAGQIQDVLTTLTPREQEVINLRFGLLEDRRSHTQEEVGQEFNVTQERIRQIENKALRKLRYPSRARKLKDYLD